MDDFRVNLVKNPGMMETKMAMESGVPTSMPEAVPVQPVANPPGTVMQCAYCDGDIEGRGISVSGSKVCSEVCADEIRRNPEDKLPDYKDLVIEEVEIEDSKVMIAPFTHAGVPMYFAFEDSNSGISEAGLFITYGPKSGYSFDDYCVGTAAQANHDAVDYEWIQKYADSGWIAEKMTERGYGDDALVFITAFNLRMRNGEKFLDALEETAVTRFRPIMLTTITTVFGLLPLIELFIKPDSSNWDPEQIEKEI